MNLTFTAFFALVPDTFSDPVRNSRTRTNEIELRPVSKRFFIFCEIPITVRIPRGRISPNGSKKPTASDIFVPARPTRTYDTFRYGVRDGKIFCTREPIRISLNYHCTKRVPRNNARSAKRSRTGDKFLSSIDFVRVSTNLSRGNHAPISYSVTRFFRFRRSAVPRIGEPPRSFADRNGTTRKKRH